MGSPGSPSQTAYLQVERPETSPVYVCATSWTDGPSGGYYYAYPDQLMSDGQSCCGGSATPTSIPAVPQPAIGNLGVLHAAKDIKPQESEQPGSGPIRQNPFALAATDPAGGAAISSAIVKWHSWAGDGMAHAAPDGTGTYYFPSGLLINYVILETNDGVPVVVVGPEVSLTDDGKTPLGHPTLGACPSGGGAPLALVAGEISGTTLTNHSGRFGHDASVTPDVLNTAAALFNCLGIQVTNTEYHPPKP